MIVANDTGFSIHAPSEDRQAAAVSCRPAAVDFTGIDADNPAAARGAYAERKAAR
jgi:hypothetical protein